MRKLTSFTFVTLNGYYKGARNDTSWHQHGKEEAAFSEKQLSKNNILLFGRKTYEMMYSFWPTPQASELFPIVANQMNSAEKIVFSNSLSFAAWTNTTIYSGNIIKQVKELKQTKGKDLTILGSGSIVSTFTDADLIDEYEFMIDPIVLSKGTNLFAGLKKDLHLTFKNSQVFKKSGIVLLTYIKSIQPND